MSLAYLLKSNFTADTAITYMLSKETGTILIKNEQSDYIGIFTSTDLIKLLEKGFSPFIATFFYHIQPHLKSGSSWMAGQS